VATPIPENRASFVLDEIVSATGATLDPRAAGQTRIRSVATDSRAVVKDALFVALRGERFDGHRFLVEAGRAGATALMIERDARWEGAGVAAVRVSDTTVALGDLAAHHRTRWGGRVVAITGSAGKTSTKELVAAALDAGDGRTLKTRGNLNNLVGVPMTLFCLEEGHDLAVIEMGTSAPGEIARLGAIGRPDVAVVTLISAAHTEGLGDLAAVAREKRSLLDALGPAGVAVLNADDPELADVQLGGRTIVRFGVSAGADVRLVSHRVDRELATHASYEVKGVGTVEIRLRLLGESAAQNAAAALAVAVAFGHDPLLSATRLAEVPPTEGRMCAVSGGAFCVIDDSYNANPRSTEMALETARALADARGVGLVAVLADMRELGAQSRALHEALGAFAAERARGLVFVGTEMKAAAAAARRAKHDRLEIAEVADAADAVAPLRALAHPGDVVLVKGSRSMRTERVVEALTAEALS
jgi:UDP-N-acetylmuramoyl-tripeptide--D-alanyl-D-alanine ligase